MRINKTMDHGYGPSSSRVVLRLRLEQLGAGDGFRVLKHTSSLLSILKCRELKCMALLYRKNKTKTIQPLPVEGDPNLRFNWNTAML